MRKTPSYLKGLAETHGRALADVQRLERLQVEVAERLARAREELNASDIHIKKFNARLDPSRRNDATEAGSWGEPVPVLKYFLLCPFFDETSVCVCADVLPWLLACSAPIWLTLAMKSLMPAACSALGEWLQT